MAGTIRKRRAKGGYRYYPSFEMSTVDGDRQRKYLGGYDTKAEAEKALREAITRYERGLKIVEENISYSDYLEFWIENYCEMNLKPNTISVYSSVIENHIKPGLGRYSLKSINPALLQMFINKIAKEQSGSVRTITAIIKNSLKMAVIPFQYIINNPATEIRIPKNAQKKTKPKYLSKKNIKKVLSIFKNTEYDLVVKFGLYSGMRLGEIIALKWSDIDFNNDTISIQRNVIDEKNGKNIFGTPKTKSSIRIIKMGKTLRNLLKDHKLQQKKNKLLVGQYYKDSDFIITKQDGTVIPRVSVISKITYEMSKQDFYFSFHMLRHTHATLLLEQGATAKEIQERLGHSSISITMDIYSHVIDSMKEKTASFVDSFANELERM